MTTVDSIVRLKSVRQVWWLILFFAAALYAFTASAEQKGPFLRTDLCAILARPRHFDHKLVSVSARFVSGGNSSRDVLLDPRCGGEGIEAFVRGSVSDAPKLRQAVETGAPGTWGKLITGTWSGRFQCTQKRCQSDILDVIETADIKIEYIERANPPPDNSQAPIETTIDEIWARPGRFNHHLVTFTGSYLGTIHGSALYRCDSKGMIDLRSWNGAHGQEEIEYAINQNFFGSLGKNVSATWTGRISWRDDDNAPRRSIGIEVTDVRDIVASSRGIRSDCKGGVAALFAPRLSELGF